MELSKQRGVTLAALVAMLASVLVLVPVVAQSANAGTGPTVFINEIHYDNSGSDVGEAIEIAGPTGTDLTGWSVVFYNGNGGTEYDSVALSGVLADQGGGYGTTSEAVAGIQNGAPDGMALVDDGGAVIQFLSYEGSFTAVGGVADGLVSVDIGVSESSDTVEGTSMQLVGTGTTADDFTWTTGAADSFGSPNAGQTFLGDGGDPPPPLVINEIMQNPSAVSDDFGEYFEIYNAGTLDVDITGWTVKDDDSDSFVIAATLVVPADGYVVLGKDADTAVNGGVPVDYAFGGDMFLSNSSDELVLIDLDLVEVDRVNWDNGATFPDPNGMSMALIDPAMDNNVGANWCESGTAFGDGDFGSPGAANDCFVAPPVDLCVASVTHTIMEVQGSGDASPIDGAEVIVEGVVYSDFQETLDDDRLGGLFIQDAVGDGDPATSDGVFLFTGSSPVAVAPGDVVRVQGFVDEFFDDTQISVSLLQVCGSADVPAATLVDLPAPEGGSLEPYEGMHVTFGELFVSDTFNLHRFGETILSIDAPLVIPTNIAAPGSDANAQEDLNARSIVTLDTGSDISFPDEVPYFTDAGTLRRGDSATGITGPLGFSFGAYRVYNPDVSFDQNELRPERPEVGGTLTVASFNVLNYWTTIDDGSNGGRGADSLAELARQTDKLVTAILALESDIIGLQELENNGPTAIGALVDALNAADANPTWAFVEDPEYPGGLESTNAIKVGIIYRSDVATPVGDSVADDDPIYAEDRPPVAQTFDVDGEVFTLVVNHYKSKGSSGATGLDEDQGDGQGAYNFRRTLMAEASVAFMAELQALSGDDDVLMVGDLNSYRLEDPVATLEAGGLVNLTAHLPVEDLYSFVFFGAEGQLDYAFGTPSLADLVTGAAIWHINADEPRVLDYNDGIIDPAESSSAFNQPVFDPSTPYKSSDHDAVLVGIEFCDTIAPVISATPSLSVLWPPNHKYVDITVDVVASDNSGVVNVELISAVSSEAETGRGDNTLNDVIVVDDTTFKLRAERHVNGSGRVYTITYEATDDCGNTAIATAEVTVPRHMRRGATAV